eukprot:TRINITY_DN9180_c0_g1_i1.p1 TRINITY_DN9180_c0_g1~~TRINITY_DN9180_c0_g1_i1.p1  ORF type:complete len:103 (+),score=17.10 TRINITY_DN9180_c0_g1_i1:223-531(+)
MWFGPIPIYWVAVHSNVTENGFIDSQQQGPMKFWMHTHSFEEGPEAGTTTLRDKIEYEHQGGLKGLFTKALFNTMSFKLMFLYRKLYLQYILDTRSHAEKLA